MGRRACATPEPPNRLPRAFAAARAARAIGNRLRFMFGDGRDDVDREPVRLREIHGFKLDLRLHQVGDEGDVTGQAVRLDKLGALKATRLQGLCEF
jgi:hypothetical protein